MSVNEVAGLRAELEQTRKNEAEATAAWAKESYDAQRYRDALERIARDEVDDVLPQIARDALAGDK